LLLLSGLATGVFNDTPALRTFFKILSLSLDKQGVPYISTLEALKVLLHFQQPHVRSKATRGRM
jgi:hypothetical protein